MPGPFIRVLMVVPKYPFPIVGGLERQAHELAKTLARNGNQVYGLSYRFHPDQSSTDSVDGIRVHRVLWHESKPVRFLLSSFVLTRALILLRGKIDLVHVHNTSWFGGLATVLAKCLGVPVLTKLPNYGQFGIPDVRYRRFGYLRVALLKLSDAVVAMTPESALELTDIGFPEERVLKVPNGIPLLPPQRVDRHPGEEAPRIALFVGRLTPQKGLPDLLRAWSLVASRATHKVRLRIVGEGPQESELRELVAILKLSDIVDFVGYSQNVRIELGKADIFVLPSYFEGNSNAVLEAMREGLPVVATRVGGAALQVGPEGERFLVTPRDCRGLADRLLELIEDDGLRIRTGAAMRIRLASAFGIEHVGATYQHAYQLMLSGRRKEIGQLNSGFFEGKKAERMSCAA